MNRAALQDLGLIKSGAHVSNSLNNRNGLHEFTSKLAQKSSIIHEQMAQVPMSVVFLSSHVWPPSIFPVTT